MLGASATHADRPVDLAAIGDRSRDPLIEGGIELLDFTDALVGGDDTTLDRTRHSLVGRLGPEAAAKASSCAGNFEMMNRILDATGVPVSAQGAAIRSELGLAD